MKLLPLIFIVLVGCASVPFEDWDLEDTERQFAFIGLLAIDWNQTRSIISDPLFYETNPILGRDPSSGYVDFYMIGCAVGHTIISGLLEPEYWRPTWQYGWIIAEGYTVYNNRRIGVE